LILLAACQPPQRDEAAVERIDLDAAIERAPPVNGGLPDAAGAAWELALDNRSLRFANPAGEPLLSLACELPSGGDPRILIVQHAPAPPGAKALFAIVGNGMVARIAMDARNGGSAWRWEGRLSAATPKLDVLTGDREVAATMPGGGEIALGASDLPRRLIEWCRNRGAPPPSPAASPSPSPTASPA
jgi:hypothetical protein